MKNKTVILLDGQTVQGIAIAKSLYQAGWKVILFCDTKSSYGYWTRYGKKVLVPNISNSEEEYLQFLKEFLEKNLIDLLFPLNDDSASFLSRHKKSLSKLSNFIIPDHEIFVTGYDKNNLMKVCQENDFPHPTTCDLELAGLELAAKKVGFPALIKPNSTTGGRGITLVSNLSDLKKFYPQVRKVYGPCHLQQFIQPGGKQVKVQIFLNKNGELVNSTVIHKQRFYPENGGSSCCNVTIDSPEVVELCSNVLKIIGWIGFADFDLIEDPTSGELKIIEINPRVPACIKSSIISGVNFPILIANESLGLDYSVEKYRPGKYLRYFGLDTLWFIYSNQRFKSKPNWFKLINKNVYYQEGGWDDPLPFICGSLGGFIKQLSPKFRKAKAGLR